MSSTTSVSASPVPAPIPADAKKALSGLDQLRAIRDGRLGLAPMQAPMNMRLGEAENERVVLAGVPKETHYNPAGSVHRAFTAAMLDSAMGCAVLTTLPAGIEQTTIEVKWNLVRPMFAATGEVRAESWIVHRGRTIATAEGRLLDKIGKLIAHGNTTIMIFAAK